MIRQINVQTGAETSRPLNAQEQIAADTQTAQELAEKPMREWKASMQKTDSSCPRWFEDYVTENSVALAPGKSKESYDAKVLLRSNKPL